jgi:uncharacterized heparinase superfamily protein
MPPKGVGFPDPLSGTLKSQCAACRIVAGQETFIVNSEQARQQAEKRFKQEERARDGRKAMTEYEAEARATREKTARLKALRSAKEAQARDEPPPSKLAERRPTRRQK